MIFRYLCLVLFLPVLTGCQSLSSPAPTVAPDADRVPAPRLLLISVDGLRADMLDQGLTPNLQALAQRGVRARWMTPSYPSLTFPNHYTLVTGLRPDHHGIIHNSMRDDTLGSFELADRAALARARWWGGEPIWVSAEKAGVVSATWAWPGSEAQIGGHHATHRVAYDAAIPLQQRVLTVLDWLSMRGPSAPRFATLYIENVDKAGHRHGPGAPEYRQAVQQADAVIGQVLEGLVQRGLSAGTNIIVVSDHGMAALPAGQVLSTEEMVPSGIAEAVSVSQPVGFKPLPGREREAEAALLGRHAHYQCWRKGELPARWAYGHHPRTPPIICEMDEGWDALTPELQAKHGDHYRGTHGYDNALPSMRAVFVAAGPSFKSGRTIEGFDNVDVYPLMSRLLQVPAASNDGDPHTFDEVVVVPDARR